MPKDFKVTYEELKITSYLYKTFSKDDEHYKIIVDNISLDLTKKDDIENVLKFLRSWGCRQFIKEKEDQEKSENALKKWFITYGSYLPSHDELLVNTSDKDINSYEKLFDDLMNSEASTKCKKQNKPISNTFGPVGAAKTLFALRRNTFRPWDNPIIKELQFGKNGKSYCEYLITVKKNLVELQDTCNQKGIDFTNLPKIFGRENSSMPKLIDEYLWVSITQKCKPSEIISLIN